MKNKLRQAYKKGYRDAIFNVVSCITVATVYAVMFVIWL